MHAVNMEIMLPKYKLTRSSKFWIHVNSYRWNILDNNEKSKIWLFCINLSNQFEYKNSKFLGDKIHVRRIFYFFYIQKLSDVVVFF